MNWLQFPTKTLLAPPYLSSEPLARGTWLNLLCYCCNQENEGQISACAAWTDDQWREACGVTRQEIDASDLLCKWDGENLVVWMAKAIADDSQALCISEARKVGLDPAKSRRRQRMVRARGIARHTDKEWRALLSRLGGKCLKCGATEAISKDHIIPVADGGSDGIENLQPLCRPCNSSKGAKTIRFPVLQYED